MEKLVKKFEMISKLWVGSNEPAPGMSKTTKEQRYAEECKKVAIAFNTYVYNLDTCEYTDEEMFDKFIEEYYGK